MEKNLRKASDGKQRPWEKIPDFTIYFYDPVKSLFSGSPRSFVNRDGKPVEARKETKQILHLASEAADCLLRDLGVANLKQNEWIAVRKSIRETLDWMRADLPLDRIRFLDESGNDVPPPAPDDISPQMMASFITQTSSLPGAPAELAVLARQLWCLICLTHVDSALLAQLYEDAGDAMGSYADAAEALRNARGPEVRNTTMAQKGAMAKLAADPKQADKRAVRECWELWREEPTRYDGKAAFARDMLQKFEALKSAVVIERWCREWERTEQAQ